jgi:hypothetical protein
MTEPAKSKNDVPLETSIPADAVPLDSVLCTEELGRRPWRPPDHAKENRALVALANALAESPHTILQTLAETILDVTIDRPKSCKSAAEYCALGVLQWV